MLWYKAWLDTRMVFWIGLTVLLVMACGNVIEYPSVQKLLPVVGSQLPAADDAVRVALEEAIQLSRTFRGFIWHNWFQQPALTLGALFAALLGTSRLFSTGTRGLLFTLSLPVSRRRWLVTRAATGLIELLALIVGSSLMIPLLAPVIGQHYDVGDALVHALCAFCGTAALFGLALLLSTTFRDKTRPIVISCLLAIGAAFATLLVPHAWSIVGVLSAEDYFRGGSLPWAGLGVFAVATAAFLFAAARKVDRLEF